MPQVYYHKQLADTQLAEKFDDGTTLADTLLEVVRTGKRQNTAGGVMFHAKNDTWVCLRMMNGHLVLELGEPGC